MQNVYQTIFSAAGAGADWALNCFDTEDDEDDNNIHNLTLPTSISAKYYSNSMSYLQYCNWCFIIIPLESQLEFPLKSPLESPLNYP